MLPFGVPFWDYCHSWEISGLLLFFEKLGHPTNAAEKVNFRHATKTSNHSELFHEKSMKNAKNTFSDDS